MQNSGFTLIELMVSIAILTVIGALGFTALQTSVSSVALADAQAEVQRNVRDAMTAMTNETEFAAKANNAALGVQGLQVVNSGASSGPGEVLFQVPIDNTGVNWSRPIRFRFVNEDLNGNSWLDPGENVNGDKTLTRAIMRIQDRNGNGTTNDPGETAPIGGANNLSSVQFARNGDILTITLTSTKLVGLSRKNPVRATLSSRVYLAN